MKVGLVDLGSLGGKIKFEFCRPAPRCLDSHNFSAIRTQVHKADFLKITCLYNWNFNAIDGENFKNWDLSNTQTLQYVCTHNRAIFSCEGTENH